MRLLPALIALLPLVTPALAQTGCAFENATYVERDNGYELRFRHPQPWESSGMTSAVFEMVMPDGTELWGTITSNMGTSRDVGHLFYGCSRPGPDDGVMTADDIAACEVWKNVVYGMADGEPEMIDFYDEPAPPALLLADLGRVIRYSGLVMSPGEEPWDYFTFKSCAV